MTLSDFFTFIAVAAAIAVVTHWLIRRYWLAVVVSALVVSLVTVAYQIARHYSAIGPSDAVFWLPAFFIMGAYVAVVPSAIVGIPFSRVRRRRQTNAA